MKIAVIEDELLIQLSLKTLLTRRGHLVKTYTSGVAALEAIKVESFDKIICDLMLSDITGFDIIEESKNLFGLEQVQKIFIIITAYNNDQILTQAKAYSVPIFIKPFNNIEELCHEIERTKNNPNS